MNANARHATPAPSLLSAALLAALLVGCAPKTVVVAVPPRIDLTPYGTIGIVEFTPASEASTADLDRLATQRFMTAVQASQPSVRFLELGPADRVLQAAGLERIDPEAIRAIGRAYGVDTLFTGTYDISGPKPHLALGPDLSSVSAAVAVRISVAVRHWDAERGATLWTNARYGEWPIAEVHKGAGRPILLGAVDPRDRYGDFLGQLIAAVTDDFSVHYERRPAGTE